MDKRKIVRYLLITLSVILGVLVFLSITGTVAHAAGLVDNTVSDANAYSKYPLENYQLDFYVDSSWDWLPAPHIPSHWRYKGLPSRQSS